MDPIGRRLPKHSQKKKKITYIPVYGYFSFVHKIDSNSKKDQIMSKNKIPKLVDGVLFGYIKATNLSCLVTYGEILWRI